MLNKWLQSVADAGKDLLNGELGWFSGSGQAAPDMERMCQDLLSSKGEAMGTALAFSVADACQNMDDAQKVDFFQLLLDEFSIAVADMQVLIDTYRAAPSRKNLHELHRRSEPPRQELFRRINMAPGGTQAIVALREHLLKILPDNPDFEEIDSDLQHIIASWFNRGFLQLQRIDWQTPAFILEKLIKYEAVHAMDGWEDLRRRLADDRRCFAFFHPAMPDEPLIFVEIALTDGLSTSVQELLVTEVDPAAETTANTATFYSISDCQRGLRGISFGNFLLKQVIMELRSELPQLSQFATLSPIPGFCRWLGKQLQSDDISPEVAAVIEGCGEPETWPDIEHSDEARQALMTLCADYLKNAKQGTRPLDPVSRFHLSNGACIEQLNWAADRSESGIRRSAGIMVNYLYDLPHVEERHENYVNDQVVTVRKGL